MKKRLFLWVILFFCFSGFQRWLAAEEAMQEKDSPTSSPQIIEVTESFKHAIEENQRLLNKNKELETELQKKRSDYLESKRQYDDLLKETDHLKKRFATVKEKQEEFQIANEEKVRLIKSLQRDIQELEEMKQGNEEKIKELEDTLSGLQKEQQELEEICFYEDNPQGKILKTDYEGLDLLEKVSVFEQATAQLKQDSAMVHFELGDSYVKEGDMESAVQAYLKAISFEPSNPDFHFQLAFVSSGLEDYQTALKHYQIYLELNPNAQNRNFVEVEIQKAKQTLGLE